MPKPFLTYEQQLIKLRDEKHLVINDESAACCKLRQISYYSLVSGYKHLFRVPAQKIYKDGTTFEEIVSLYEFDESLRELFLRYLLHIERHIRSLLSYYFTEKYGESQTAYLTKTNYNYVRKHQQGIDRLVNELQKLTQTTQHSYIAYQRNAGGFVQRDNGKFHVRCDGGEIDFAVLPAILHDSQDAHINSDFFRTDGTGSVVHRLFSFVCKRKRPNRVFQYSIVSVHSHAAVCAASVPAA